MNKQETHRPRAGAPGHDEQAGHDHGGGAGKGLHKGMALACVAIMGGGAALLMWRGVGSGWWLLPMVLCLGAHFLLHRTHSGHGK